MRFHYLPIRISFSIFASAAIVFIGNVISTSNKCTVALTFLIAYAIALYFEQFRDFANVTNERPPCMMQSNYSGRDIDNVRN